MFLLLKPQGFLPKLFVWVLLIGIAYAWANGHFEVVKQYADTPSLTFSSGNFSISLYTAMKALLNIIIIVWITSFIADFADKKISSLKSIKVANKALIQKILQIVIYLLAFLIFLNVLGINLTSLTVLSGAVGIGLGFGLQKIAANFISGFILTLERSLKIGDLIELEDGTFGYVRKSSSRATLIETIDGKEVLVPNEEFIIKQVVNWTLNNSNARIEINFGVSYGSDIELARDLAIQAAKENERCVTTPDAVCWLDNFGDSSVNFILYFWIEDINLGLRNVRSEVLFSIWKKFKENNIEIPFPQRDLNIRSPETISIHHR